MAAADLAARGRRIGFVLVAVAIGMALGGFLTGGFSSSNGASATSAIGPDIGEIRVSPDAAGPTDKVDGVGVGFARTEDGAVAAATNLVLTLEQAVSADRAEALRAYEILAADASRSSLVQEMAASWDALHGGIATNGPIGSSLFLRTVPVGHELVRYSPDRATVEIWTLNVFAATGMAEPMARWETASIEVVWEDDDWKVWSARTAAGPNPAWGGDAPTDLEPFLAEIERLEGFRYVPG